MSRKPQRGKTSNPCVRCGAEIPGQVPPGLPGYGWADKIDFLASSKANSLCESCRRGVQPVFEHPVVKLDAAGQAQCPRCHAALEESEPCQPGLAGYGWADEFLLCPECGASFHKSLIDGNEPPPPPPRSAPRPRVPRPSDPGPPRQSPRKPPEPSPPDPRQVVPPSMDEVLIKGAENLRGAAPTVFAAPAESRPTVKRPRVPLARVPRHVPVGQLERSVLDFWRQEDIGVLQLARNGDGAEVVHVMAPPATRTQPELWRDRVLDDVLIRFRLMTGARVVRIDPYAEPPDPELEEWLGLLGASQLVKNEPYESSEGADAVRFYLCSSHVEASAPRPVPSAVQRVSSRYLGPLWAAYRRIVTVARRRGLSLPARFPGELFDHAYAVASALDELRPERATRELIHMVDKVTDAPGLMMLARVTAPITPFIAESIYRNLAPVLHPDGPFSVHLTRFP